MRIIKYFFIYTTTLLLTGSCKKLVTVDPPKNRLVTQSVFTSDAGATSAIAGLYSDIMQTTNGFASGALTLYAGLSSDELKDYSNTEQAEFYSNSLQSANGLNLRFWAEGYNRIYAANSIIEGLQNSSGMSNAVKLQLEGEAKFVRALCHFILVNIYGDVPLVLSTSYQNNSVIRRSAVANVYNQIILDLTDAQSMLSIDYSFSNGERIRPNKWAATALLARVYLYKGDWVDAEAQSSTVIGNTSMYSLVGNLNSVFLKNSIESIWQLMPVRTDVNTSEGEAFILTGPPDNVALAPPFLTSFEKNDNRQSSWIDSLVFGGNTYYYPFKYKIKTSSSLAEYYTVFRLAEQYLIRAEARAEQNNLSGCISDLNIIRNRAGLANLPANLSQSQCLLATEQERKVEMFCEWGHRWFDLKRTNRATAILGVVKVGWQATDALYPIPQTEILNNPMISQNPGY